MGHFSNRAMFGVMLASVYIFSGFYVGCDQNQNNKKNSPEPTPQKQGNPLSSAGADDKKDDEPKTKSKKPDKDDAAADDDGGNDSSDRKSKKEKSKSKKNDDDDPDDPAYSYGSKNGGNKQANGMTVTLSPELLNIFCSTSTAQILELANLVGNLSTSDINNLVGSTQIKGINISDLNLLKKIAPTLTSDDIEKVKNMGCSGKRKNRNN